MQGPRHGTGYARVPLCRNMQQLGHCRYGAACRYSHGGVNAGGGSGNGGGGRGSSTQATAHRDWVWAQDCAPADAGRLDACNLLRFTFMTYNILADDLAQTHWAELYSEVPKDAMVWELRFPRIMADIARHLPDIVNLQEVDKLDDFQRHMGMLGYQGEFVRRTGGRLDGCATFWLCGKFKLVSCERLEFRDQGLRDNVALLTVLQPRVSPRSATATAAASSSVAKVPPHSDAAATPVMTPVHSATATVAPLLHGAAPTSAVPATRCTQAASGSGVSATSAPNGRQHKGLAAEAGGCSSAVAANGFHAASASTPAPEGGSPAAVVNGGARPEATRGRAEGYNGAGDGLADRSAAVSLPPIVVANTHILFNPARGDIKVAQCRTVLEAVHRAAGGGPCILAGDFNSHPGSAVHRFCRNGTLLLAGEDRRCMSGQKALGGSPARRWVAEELQTVLGRRSTGREDQTVQHPLPLASAYEAVTGEEAAFSTSHGKATAGKTVDYVWFRPLGTQWDMRAEAVLAAPHPASLQQGLPSKQLPSDHIPLVARFALRGTTASADAAAAAANAGTDTNGCTA